MKFKVKNDTYEVSYSSLKIEDGDIYVEDLVIKKNGIQEENFGENFAGHKYTPYDVLEAVIFGYINNDQTVTYEEMPEEAEALKREIFDSVMTVAGREIPKKYYKGYQGTLDLQMITHTGAAYLGADSYVLVDTDGALVTDIEAFFTSGIIQMYRDDVIYYITPETKKWLDEYIEEEESNG